MPIIRQDYRAATDNVRASFFLGTAASLAIILSPEALAQSADALIDLNGNDAQEDAARLVDDTCPELVPAFQDGTATSAQVQLVTVCTNMIVDQFRLQPEPGNPVFQLLDSNGDGQLTSADDSFAIFPGYGLDAEDLNNALQGLSGEEIQAAQSRFGEVRTQQTQNIFSRLAAIRSGQAGGGISVANLDLETGDQIYRTSDLAGLDQDKYEILPAAWLEDETWSKLGIFVTGGVTFGDKDTTGQSDGFDFDSLNLAFGGDYRITDAFVVGAALGYNRFDSEVDTTARSPAGEDLGSDGYLISLFASHSWNSGLFVDGVASYGQDEYDSTRRIVINSSTSAASVNETADGNFDSEHYGFAAILGYQIETRGFTITPVARIEYVNAEFDGFTESGATGLNLTFDDFDAETLRGQLGVEASYSISTDQGVIVPSLRAEFIHEFENEDSGAQIKFASGLDANAVVDITTEGVDENYGLIGASITAVAGGGMSAFVDYATVVALDDFEVHQIKAGVRWEF